MTLDETEKYILRPVIAGKATLEEIERHWSLVDLARVHQLLDVNEEAEEYYQKLAEQERNK